PAAPRAGPAARDRCAAPPPRSAPATPRAPPAPTPARAAATLLGTLRLVEDLFGARVGRVLLERLLRGVARLLETPGGEVHLRDLVVDLDRVFVAAVERGAHLRQALVRRARRAVGASELEVQLGIERVQVERQLPELDHLGGLRLLGEVADQLLEHAEVLLVV